ncbi:hypothetical protein [Streptomyces achromogenes]|uniref:hypothetical protein n=1 Tax=Streptomyces achromogenes TaxID=67255 RepID=UPI0036895134
MAVRAVRGAVPLERDDAGHMAEQAGAPLTAVLGRDGPTADDLIIESDQPRAALTHVYLGAAAALRKDIAQ